VTFFFDGDAKAREVDSLCFSTAHSLRLLRAYAKIKDQTVQRQSGVVDGSDRRQRSIAHAPLN
jgi:hypothetical protein